MAFVLSNMQQGKQDILAVETENVEYVCTKTKENPKI